MTHNLSRNVIFKIYRLNTLTIHKSMSTISRNTSLKPKFLVRWFWKSKSTVLIFEKFSRGLSEYTLRSRLGLAASGTSVLPIEDRPRGWINTSPKTRYSRVIIYIKGRRGQSAGVAGHARTASIDRPRPVCSRRPPKASAPLPAWYVSHVALKGTSL